MMKSTNITIKTVDPVCGMNVQDNNKILMSSYNGIQHYFCGKKCRKVFENNPQKYLESSPKKKGIWGRYLERLNKATGGRPPSCCS